MAVNIDVLNIIEIINQIALTSSTNEKINILKREKDNEVFKKILYYTYSDHLQYGFSERKLRELLESNIYTPEETWDNVFDMLDVLSKSNINDSLRANVISFLRIQIDEIKELYIKILTKDLRCNISTKTINKAIKGLIKSWEIQQAYQINNVKLKKGEWIALALKLNGVRSSYLSGQFRSRQNKIMHGLEHIIKDLTLLGLDGCFVDGEMIRKNTDNISDNENFRLTTSILNSDNENKSDIEFVIFDILPKEEFAQGESKSTFKERLHVLYYLKRRIELLELKNIRIMPVYYTGTDHSMIEKVLDEVDGQGLEGIMCLRDSTYKTKRHKGILKCKKFLEADLKIVGYEEGNGKYIGKLGSFIVDYKGTNVGVGTGWTDEEREKYWIDRDEYLGKILQVRYKEETMDKETGLVSLQFPSRVCIRFDKNEPSYN